MPLDDRFDDLVTSLTGFYRAWVIQLGMELGLFARLREAGAAFPPGAEPEPVEVSPLFALDAEELRAKLETPVTVEAGLYLEAEARP